MNLKEIEKMEEEMKIKSEMSDMILGIMAKSGDSTAKILLLDSNIMTATHNIIQKYVLNEKNKKHNDVIISLFEQFIKLLEDLEKELEEK